MRKEYVEAVLAVVELVPPGTAVAYGDVAELLGAGGPRQVGAVMSHYGSGVPWWRILKASGQAPEGHDAEALRHYLDEGTPLLGSPDEFLRTGDGRWRVDLAAARWAPTKLNSTSWTQLRTGWSVRLHKLSVADDEMSV